MKQQTTKKNTRPVAPKKPAPDLEKSLEFIRLQQAVRQVQERLRAAAASDLN